MFLLIYIVLSVIIGVKSGWLAGLIAFGVTWAISFAWGMSNVSSSKDGDEMKSLGIIKNVILISVLSAIALLL